MKLNNIYIALFFASSLSYANELTDVEKVTVTSSFRQTNIQEISASISVLNMQQLQDRQAQHLDDILNLAANVNFTSGASRGRFIQIRGIGERSQYAEPINPSVGLVIDGFDFSGLAAVGTLFDVEQVEVLRGPQATEFGAAGMAGTIKISTVKANSDNQPTIIDLSLAQQNSWGIGVATGGRISERLSYRVAAQQFKSDGFVENTFLNVDDTDNIDELSARFKLHFQASESLSFGLNYQYFDIDNGYDAFSLENTRQTRSDEPGFDRQKTHAVGLSFDKQYNAFNLVGNATLISSDIGYAYDEDWTYTGFHPFGYTSFDAYFRDRDSTSVDLRLISNQNALIFSETTQWLIGVYVNQVDETLRREYTYLDNNFTSQYKPSNVALYGQTESMLTEDLSLELGLRIDSFEIDYVNNEGFQEDSKDELIGGKIALDYKIGNAAVYTSISRGYKAGGFNPDQRVTEENRIYEPEYNWNYELGVKGRLPESDAAFRLAVFYMDRTNTQVSDYDVELRDDGTASFIDIIGNADTGKNWGLEFEGDWRPTDITSIQFSYGFLDATFDGYELADGSLVMTKEQAQAPKHTFSIISSIQLGENVDLKLDLEGKDDFRFSDGHDVRSPFTLLTSVYANYRVSDWTLSVWCKNLLDRRHYVRGFGGFSNDPRDGYETPMPYYQLGDGRQLGMSAKYVF